MKVAVVQPYIFPYIGYFQLIYDVDVFVFYDDVNFIKGGWINRNKILSNNASTLISIPCIKASQNKLINEIEINTTSKDYSKILKTIEFSYKKAPFFDSVFPIVASVLNGKNTLISELAIDSIQQVSNYLDIDTKFYRSSEDFSESKGMERADRLIHITKRLEADTYVNPTGGKELYDKAYFKSEDITLQFIESSKDIVYQQGKLKDFVPWLSIIDVLMYNSKEETNLLLTKYQLV